MSPRTRFNRTVLQVLIATGLATPAAVAAIPEDGDWRVLTVGIAGAAVILVSAVQNALEQKTGRG
jgi:hypothetical protein